MQAELRMELRIFLHIIPARPIVSLVNQKSFFYFISVSIIMLKMCNQYGFASQKLKKNVSKC